MPIWIDMATVLTIHDEQIEEHGGRPGLRDANLLESALARPLNLFAYGEPSILELAAAYGFGLSRNHAFIDGNKRVSLVTMEVFLLRNGYALIAPDEAVLDVWLRLAAGNVDEHALAEWLRVHARPLA